MENRCEEVIERLKSQYSEELVREGRQRRVFSKEFKAQVVAQSKAHGISTAAMAAGLGVSESAVCQWRKNSSNVSFRFQKLKVLSETKSASIQESGPYLEGKTGIRVVGLSLAQVAELMRYL